MGTGWLAPRRRRWALGAALVLVIAVVAIWGFGGFRETSDVLPVAGVGERVDLGRYALTVTGASTLTTDEDGKPLEDDDGTAMTVLVVDVTAEMLDVEAGDLLESSPGSDNTGAVRVQSGRSPWDSLPVAGGGPLYDALQPGVPQHRQLWFVAPSVTPTAVQVVLGQQEYAWTNMINGGPAWASVAVPAVAVPRVAVTGAGS